MSDLQVRGPLLGGTGTPSPFTADTTGAQRVVDAHGKYFDCVRVGNVYFLAATAANPAAFTGGAAGTPLLALMNPANSNKLLVLMQIRLGVRTCGTAATNQDFMLYGGPSILPTGTVTVPTNMLSLNSAGSAAKGFVNTALTGSTALAAIMPTASIGTTPATTDTKSQGLYVDDIAGIVLVSPGNLIALGAAAAPTAGSFDASFVWEEVPYLL